MVELVIRPQRWQGPGPDAVGKEYLCGGVYPALAGPQLRPVRGDVEQEPCPSTLQGDSSEQQGDHHEVGEQGREPDYLHTGDVVQTIQLSNLSNLSWRVQPFPYDEVYSEPAKTQSAQ